MTPHHHRWVKAGPHTACSVMSGPGAQWCGDNAVTLNTTTGKWHCRFHDPRRPPTPAEREERRVLLREAKKWGTNIRLQWVLVADMPHEPTGKPLSRILESAAYSWTSGEGVGRRR